MTTTTRFYFSSTTAAAVSPAFDSDWGLTGQAVRRKLKTVPGATGSAGAVAADETSASVIDVLCGQFVSDGGVLPVGPIAGTFDLVCRCRESGTGQADMIQQVRIHVFNAAGTVKRGTIYDGQTATSVSATASDPNAEFDTSLSTSRILSGIALVPGTTAQSGDILVVEHGTRACNVSTTSRTATMDYRDDAVADLALTAGLSTANRPWLELHLVDPPTGPTGLTIDPDVTTADLDWNAVSGATGYEVRLNGGSATDVGNVLTHTFTGLTGATAYNSPGAEVRAYNAGGYSSWSSISFTTDSAVPNAPTGLGQSTTPTSATLTWSASTGAPTGYDVRINGGTPIDVGNVLTHTFTGLNDETAYTLEVRAYNLAGDSSWASIGATTGQEAPGTPTGLDVDSDLTELTLNWTASSEEPDGYDVRINGGTPIDVGNVLTHTFTGLTPSTTYTLEVRAYNEAGDSAWASISGETVIPPEADYWESVRLVIGPDEDPIDILGSAVHITIRRGLAGPGVTNTLEPGFMQATIRDASINPVSDENTRPNRPIRVLGLLEDNFTWAPVFVGTIRRARLVFTQYEEAEEIAVVIEADDSVAALANLPSITAVSGTFAQRVAHVLAPTGLPYDVTDTQPDGASGPLLTDETTALGQLVLARDTMHGVLHVDKAGIIQAYADRDRPSLDVATVFSDSFTDAAAIYYTHLEPEYDTSDLVNVIDVETVGQENPETFSDAASVAEWGAVRDRVRVNGGSPPSHAARYMAGRIEPKLIVKRIQFNATDNVSQAVGLEVNTAAQVIREGLVGDTFQILGLEHTITARRWLTGVTFRTLERVPVRWMDVPADITWADVPADLTWNDAALWEPT